MFGLSKRERFKRAFFDFLSAEVFGLPKAKLLSHYPGLRKACDAGAHGTFPAKDSATFAARAVIVDLIGKIGDVRREKVHIEYSSLNWDEFYVWYLNSRIHPAAPPREIDNLTRVIARAQCAVTYAFKLGELDEMAYEDFQRDIAGALEGLSESERRMERLRSSMDITTTALGMDPSKFRPPI